MDSEKIFAVLQIRQLYWTAVQLVSYQIRPYSLTMRAEQLLAIFAIKLQYMRCKLARPAIAMQAYTHAL